MPSPTADPYDVLGVPRQATRDAIRKAYREQARLWHPDRRPGDAEAVERFKEVAAAWEILGDPERRAAYDLRAGRPTSGWDEDVERVAAAVERAEDWVRRGVLPQVAARWRGVGAEALVWALGERSLRAPAAVPGIGWRAARRVGALGAELVVTLAPGGGPAVQLIRHRAAWEIRLRPTPVRAAVSDALLDDAVLELLVDASLRCWAVGRVPGDPSLPSARERARSRDDAEEERLRTQRWLWGSVALVVVVLLAYGLLNDPN